MANLYKQRGYGRDKGANRGTVKNSLVRSHRWRESERETKRERRRGRNIKREFSEENIFPFLSPSISSSNFVAVSQRVWKSVEPFHREVQLTNPPAKHRAHSLSPYMHSLSIVLTE